MSRTYNIKVLCVLTSNKWIPRVMLLKCVHRISAMTQFITIFEIVVIVCINDDNLQCIYLLLAYLSSLLHILGSHTVLSFYENSLPGLSILF